MTNVLRRSLVLIMLFAILAACGSRTAEIQDAVASTAAPTSEPADTDSDTQAQAQDKPTTAPTKPKPTVAPTNPKPTATPEVKKEELKVEEFGFAQDKKTVAYAFKISNPNTGFAIEGAQYQLAAYDKDGGVLKTDSGYLSFVLPEQLYGLAGTMYLDSESAVVDKIEIQLSDGRYEATKPLPLFTTEQVAYIPGEYGSKVAGIVTNPYSKDIGTLQIAAIAYNNSGAIIGSGFTYLNFLPASGTAAVMMSVTTQEEPANIELYASFSSLSALEAGDKNDAKPITITAEGYGQDEDQVGYGMIVKNPNASLAYEGSEYQVAVYAEDGSVLGVEEGYLGVLLPNQETGSGGNIYIPKGSTVGKVVMQVRSGRSSKEDSLSSFTSENATFNAGDYSSKVTGSIKSAYSKDIKLVRISAVTFDESGAITGGGNSYVDFVPADGQATAEVTVVASGTPAKAELYATVSTLSDLK